MEAVIRTAIADALKELGIELEDFSVEHPGELAHGDYACNAAMVAAKRAGQAPRAIAEQLRAALDGQIEYVDRIEVAGPGFLNFYLARDFFAEEVTRINELKDAWGKHDVLAGQTYVVEYTDPNPFKEFHIGHLFTNTVGESIARLIENVGANTKRVCYQGDVGLHVACAVWGMRQLGLSAEAGFTAKDLGAAYAKGATANKEDEAAAAAIKALNKTIYERSDVAVNELYDAGRAVSLAYFAELYKKLGTDFVEFFFESEAGPKGKELVVAHPEIFTESDGAKVFVGEEYGLHTRVFLNREGLPTYEAKELALAKMKEERLGGYDHSIIATANEVNDYFKVLLKVMSLVYPELAERTEHIGHGMVRLSTGKMSSRTGDVIAATDFIDEITAAAAERIAEASPELKDDTELAVSIALGAIKYATLKGNILQDSVFNKEEALSFEGASGPYLQYTHARINSVAQKAAAAGITPSVARTPAEPYVLEKLLYRFSEVTLAAADERAPHTVVQYLTELAGAFNTFYAHEKIADQSDEFAPYKLMLSLAVAQTLKNGLYLLGIKAPERM